MGNARLFQRKKIEEPAAEAILGRLRRLSLLDDEAFARSWVASRHLLKNTSKRRLQLELKQKGVSQTIIDIVLAEDEVDERKSLAAVIAKKRARYPDPSKLLQYLLRQGFSYDDIKTVLAEHDEDTLES
jgi:regulatory protein